jgi:hypothetical protein
MVIESAYTLFHRRPTSSILNPVQTATHTIDAAPKTADVALVSSDADAAMRTLDLKLERTESAPTISLGSRSRVLGFVDEITAKALELVNAQIRFKDVAQRFADVRIPQLGVATQAQYRSQIDNHLVPAFGEQKLFEIDRSAVEQFLTVKTETLGWWARNNLLEYP